MRVVADELLPRRLRLAWLEACLAPGLNTEHEHAPVIVAPKNVRVDETFKVVIEIGRRPHPDEHDHFIEWIELCCGETLLFMWPLPARETKHRVSARLNAGRISGPLIARVKCSRHGVWTGRKIMSVDRASRSRTGSRETAPGGRPLDGGPIVW